ncbi:TadE/TadG family type IV pilus assembly protein [Allosphingosinicella humi]
MRARSIGGLWHDRRGAVAPTVALSLIGLIAVGGVAFDYARMASLDTELQNAADHAALAAAGQLDGKTGARTRGISAAQSLVANITYFANDGGNRAVTVPTIVFFEDKAKTTVATSDAAANFVEVTVGTRSANFALTPIVAMFNSGPLAASAFAGMGSAVCKVPPLMLCNPDEPIGNTNPDFDFNIGSRVGVGMRLVGDGSYVPGNFGFLETGFGTGANNLLKAMGYNSPPGDCVAIDGVTTKTGLNASVMDGLNTRFDINANGNTCPGGGPCSPSINERKDLVRGNDCGITGNGWQEVDLTADDLANSKTPGRYRPSSAAPLASDVTPLLMGHPRDICHAWSEAGSCTGGADGRIGNGVWDRAAYFRSNHAGLNWQTEPGLGPNVTRYQTYVWEMGDLANRLKTQSVGSRAAYGTPQAGQCLAPGIAPGGTNPDRRRISAAVLNCRALNTRGHEVDQPVVKWIDLFLVEPSYNRTRCSSGSGCNDKITDKTDIYVEVIGETATGAAGNTAGQVVRRDVPYLIE